MNRRGFIKIGSMLIAFGGAGCTFWEERKSISDYPIIVDSNRSIGHLARKELLHGIVKETKVDVLIVGGGIAGLAAACSLENRETIVCELGSKFGGTSSTVNIGNQQYSQGAHYDLSYPEYYGAESISLLEKLGIIFYNGITSRWDFNDKQHLIKEDIIERCYNNGKIHPSVLPDSELKQNFLDLIKPYIGKMVLPTRLIEKNLMNLDQITFSDYLNKYLPTTSEFMEAIDYQMLDDYGGKSDHVSALAGIHYYKCRPYYSQPEPEIFSPTEGNFYFIQKMMDRLAPDQMRANSLVVGLEKLKKGWAVDVWEVDNDQKVRYICNNVIYAGQKNLLKYLHPESYKIFSDVIYAPWVVMNIELKGETIEQNFWQNDFLSENGQFIGFVNSYSQTEKGNRVLTAYYCYPHVYHHMIQEVENEPKGIVEQTVGFINSYFSLDISPFIKNVYVKVLGHAMPIPIPGYLSKNRSLCLEGLAFAGADTGRLPLMLDSLDSGILASQAI